MQKSSHHAKIFTRIKRKTNKKKESTFFSKTSIALATAKRQMNFISILILSYHIGQPSGVYIMALCALHCVAREPFDSKIILSLFALDKETREIEVPPSCAVHVLVRIVRMILPYCMRVIFSASQVLSVYTYIPPSNHFK